MSEAAAAAAAAEVVQDNVAAEHDGSASPDEVGEGEFVNTGLQRWEEARSQWLSHKSLDGPLDPAVEPPRHAINIDVDEIIDLVISNRWRDAASTKRGSKGTKVDGCSFSQPIPLPQMIDVLLDLWEAEGLEM